MVDVDGTRDREIGRTSEEPPVHQGAPRLRCCFRFVALSKCCFPAVRLVDPLATGPLPLETLALLEGCVDIYLPEVKFTDMETATRYTFAEDYPDVAKGAIREMHRQVGDFRTDGAGRAIGGLLVAMYLPIFKLAENIN